MRDLSVEAALERILAGCHPLDPREVASVDAAGYATAHDITAPHPLPPFRNAGMDGYALRVADLAAASGAAPVALPVSAVAQAGGALVAHVAPGTVVRIMTGAPLPDDAEAVVPLEETTTREDGHIIFTAPVRMGQHVRPPGEDVPAGAVAIPAGQVVRAAEIGLLCALGITRVSVVRRPRVAIISTGDELLPPDAPLQPGKIRDANSAALAACVRDYGGEPLLCGIVRDTEADLRDTIERAVRDGADMVITSAGASAGDYDIVSGMLRQGDALEVWRVNLKPGRPLLYGHASNVPLIGLPGNPASALIVAELFVRPAISRMRGVQQWQRPGVRATLQEPQRGSSRRHYVRARLSGERGSYTATTHGIGKGSGSLTTLVRANALLIIPEGVEELPAGSEVEALLL